MMLNKKYLVPLFASLIMFVPVLTVSATSRYSASASADITLNVAAQGLYANGRLIGVIRRWNRIHPNIKINYINLPSPTQTFSQYFTPLNVALAGGERIDVWQTIQPYATQYLQNGAAANLAPLAKQAHYDLAKNFGPFLSELGTGGQIAFLPETRSYSILYYNAGMFKAAHLPFPNSATTWPELVKMAIKLSHGQGANKVYGYVPSAGSPASLLNPAINAGWNWVTAKGAPDFKNPLVAQDFTYYKEMIDAGAMPSLYELMQGHLNNRMMLANKQAAMISNNWWTPVGWNSYRWDSNSMWQHGIDVSLGLTYPPNLRHLQKVQNESASWGWQVSSKTKYPKQAFEFAQFLATENSDVLGVIPATSGASLAQVNHMIQVYVTMNHAVHKNTYPLSFVKKYDEIYQNVKAVSSVMKVPQPDAAVVNALQNLVNQDAVAYFTGKMPLNALLNELQSQGAQVLQNVH